MKKINYLLTVITISMFIVGCTSDPDNNLPVADNAGMIVNVSHSNGLVSGIPDLSVPLTDAEVTFSTVYLNFDARLNLGNQAGVSKYELVKTYKKVDVEGQPANIESAEVSVTETTSLPFNYSYSSIDDFVSGLNIVASDLRIGDQFTFKLKVHQTDGDVYYFSPSQGQMKVVVNCASDLAGSYTNPAAPTCNGSNPITVSEDSPGRYYVSSMTNYSWTSGNCIGFYILDVCGELKYDGGDLEDNGQSGEGGFGQVNPDGSFTFTCFLISTGYSEESTYTPL